MDFNSEIVHYFQYRSRDNLKSRPAYNTLETGIEIKLDTKKHMNFVSHLGVKGAIVRQVLAAHFIRHRRCIIEIGSGDNPISNFITHQPDVVYLLDPKLGATGDRRQTNGGSFKIVRIAKKYQISHLTPDRPFAVVLLGLSLKGFGARPEIDDEIFALLSEAGTIVIEFAKSHPRAMAQYQAICQFRNADPIVDIDLTINDRLIAEAGFADRKLVVFES